MESSLSRSAAQSPWPPANWMTTHASFESAMMLEFPPYVLWPCSATNAPISRTPSTAVFSPLKDDTGKVTVVWTCLVLRCHRHQFGPRGRPDVSHRHAVFVQAAVGQRCGRGTRHSIARRDRRRIDHCPDQVQEEPNAAAPPDDPTRLGRIPRDSTEGGKSERCAFHITSGNAARLSDSNIGIPADHAIDRLARPSRIARAADPRSSPHAVRSLERCAHDSQAVARHITALSTYLGHAHVTDTYWYLQSTPELMAHMSTAGETLHRGVAA